MKTNTILKSKNSVRLLIIIALLSTVSMVSLRSQASTPLATVTISNNSAWEIRGLYLSPVDNDNWGSDQLNGSVISSGGTYTLNVSWSQPTVKIVAEDQDGCFLTTIVDATGNSEWTITSNASRNCGGQ
jgi:hypothetical protein